MDPKRLAEIREKWEFANSYFENPMSERVAIAEAFECMGELIAFIERDKLGEAEDF